MRLVAGVLAVALLVAVPGWCAFPPPAASVQLRFGFHVRDSVTAYGPRYEGGEWESHFGAELKQEIDDQLHAAFPHVVELSSFPPAKDAQAVDTYIVVEQAIARFYGHGVMSAEAQATVSISGAEREPVQDLVLSSEYQTSFSKDMLQAKADAAVKAVVAEMAAKLVAALSDPAMQARLEHSVEALREKRERAAKAAAAPIPVAQAYGRLLVTTTPPATQVFLDDVYWGVSDAEGKLKIAGVAAGPHVVRLKKAGYKELKEPVTVAAGDNPLVLKAEVAPPKPLREAEIEEALRYDVPKGRINAMIQQYGVDFVLTKAAEIRLMDAGADKEMLQNISGSKKSANP